MPGIITGTLCVLYYYRQSQLHLYRVQREWFSETVGLAHAQWWSLNILIGLERFVFVALFATSTTSFGTFFDVFKNPCSHHSLQAVFSGKRSLVFSILDNLSVLHALIYVYVLKPCEVFTVTGRPNYSKNQISPLHLRPRECP